MLIKLFANYSQFYAKIMKSLFLIGSEKQKKALTQNCEKYLGNMF